MMVSFQLVYNVIIDNGIESIDVMSSATKTKSKRGCRVRHGCNISRLKSTSAQILLLTENLTDGLRRA